MAIEFLDPLGRGGKPSNIPGGIFWLDLVVLVERADRYSAAVCTTDFEWGREEWRLAFVGNSMAVLPLNSLIPLEEEDNRARSPVVFAG